MTNTSGVESEIERLKTELGVTLDRELAAELKIDPSSVAAWRRRGNVPDKYRLRAERKRDELVGAKGSMPDVWDLREAYVFALVSSFLKQLDEKMLILASSAHNEIWQGYRLADAHRYFHNAMPRTDDRDLLRQAFERFRDEVSAADVEWLERIGRR